MSNLFRVKNGLNLSPVDLTTLTSPQAGDLACDINDLNKIKRYDANTLGWTEVGSGGGVGNVNALLTQTFDTAALAQFTQTGLALTTSNPIDGTISAQLIHQAASSQSFKQVIAVDRKYRGDLMAMSLQVRSSATSGNLTLLVTDETNSAVIMASSSISTGQYQVATAVTNSTTTISGFSNVDINLLKVGMTITGSGIPTATVISSINTAANTIVISQAATASATITAKFSALPDRKSFSFTIPTNCASLSYTVTALPEAGLPESYVDDVVIELANVSLLETSVTVPNITAWQGYTPTFQGFGTPTSVEFEYRQVGENVEIRGKFTAGTTTAVEARVGLPAGLTSAGTGLIPSIQAIGAYFIGVTTANDGGSVLVSPSTNYINISSPAVFNSGTVNALSPALGSSVGTSDIISFFASVPCAGLTATSDVAIPLTQSGIVQEADSMVRLTGANGYGSSGTAIRRLTTIDTQLGSSITYQDSATNGATFTVLESGIYEISYSDSFGSAAYAGISKNAPSLSTGIQSVAATYVLAISHMTTATASASVSWQGYLLSGDVIRPHTSGTASSVNPISFTIAKQGSLKQVNINTNSKITIPTSELRFEGASARGAVATAIVKFDTMAKIRGDAFTVTNTANDGTYVTMTKKGKLDISATLYMSSSADMAIVRNSPTLTSITGEVLAYNNDTGAASGAISWSGSVSIGDVLRVATSSVPIANGSSNNLNIFFQEQDIQVSVSNTLPQFSESDSSVRLSGAGASPFGSVATTTRRFASVIQNLGTDIEYTDSATLGGQFRAKADGIYNVSYTENSTANQRDSGVFILVNGTSVAYDNQLYNTATIDNKIASTSWSGYLNSGDIVTGTTVPTNNGVDAKFTMSKVGKPNVTGVDVTPFVNVPQPESQSIYRSYTSGGYTGVISGALTSDTGGGVISYNSTTGIFTALKRCSVELGFSAQNSAAVYMSVAIAKNSVLIANSDTPATGGAATSTSASIRLQANETFNFQVGSGTNNVGKFSATATALSDQILTAPETFSTDTAALTYAGLGTYTLATLANAKVGTFITYTYAALGNVRTQTTTAPTQTTADMNANGILIYARPFNAASTAAQPAAIAINIGKGLKGKSVDLYKSAAKVNAGATDFFFYSTNGQQGLRNKEYTESTGILFLDAGISISSAVTAYDFAFSDLTSQASGYLVINASKNVSLTGMNIERVSARAVNTAGTSFNATGSIMVYDSVKTYDTHEALNAATGVFTAPETGYYTVQGQVSFVSAAYTTGQGIFIEGFKNGVRHSLSVFNRPFAAGTNIFATSYNDSVFLAKNETFKLNVINERGATTLNTGSGYNFFSITKTNIGGKS